MRSLEKLLPETLDIKITLPANISTAQMQPGIETKGKRRDRRDNSKRTQKVSWENFESTNPVTTN